MYLVNSYTVKKKESCFNLKENGYTADLEFLV